MGPRRVITNGVVVVDMIIAQVLLIPPAANAGGDIAARCPYHLQKEKTGGLGFPSLTSLKFNNLFRNLFRLRLLMGDVLSNLRQFFVSGRFFVFGLP